ncbi:hypothetical protein [Qipengyuania aquimaris]|uniref:Uncharacterized protein n=1 Tax=Qipengyuania aquimaris TaxID=255984 RepID=A0A9Q3XAT6_9SPHN|nr:hypothetical protein [Qipengyuania aquimaris]MBY6216758.1 hypothetical protein [Qipengyuania aquimaris]
MSEPQASGTALAPYPVWAATRVVTALAQAYALLWVIVAMVALVDAINGVEPQILPIWSFVVACVIGASGGASGLSPRSYDLPYFGETIARKMASKHCPSCGQSIFNSSPESGYTTENEQRSWWPSRICANCGHDLSRKTAGENI